MTAEITTIRQEVDLELANKETVATLVQTTFKGLQPEVMKRAIVEGMMRGFTFKDFLERNIYAIPFAGGYSLVTSIDHARKIAMRSGVIYKSAPHFVEQDGNIISCEITVKRRVGQDIGEYTALVYFDEYNTGKNQWLTKKHTMIAKVAEMHAYRMACPEEMSQSYSEEEVEMETTARVLDVETYRGKLIACNDMDSLTRTWSALPIEAKNALVSVKDEMKAKLSVPNPQEPQEAVNPSSTDEIDVSDIEIEPTMTVEQVAEAFGGTVVDEEPKKPWEDNPAYQPKKKAKTV